MTLLPRSAIVSAVFAAMAIPAFAQPSPSAAAGAPTEQAPSARQHRPDPQARQARMEKRMQAFKASLKLNASQEGAWNTYAAALKPDPANKGEHPNREAFAAMTTPQRIDAMQAMHAKRQADMERRNQATKAFYGTLTPEQQKTFDAETLKMHGREGHGPHAGKPHQARSAAKVDDPRNAK